MRRVLFIAVLTIAFSVAAIAGESAGRHLFILSGQSNMFRLNPATTFIPTVAGALGKENIIVVKDALGGQPIRRWYKAWKPEGGEVSPDNGDLYDRLLAAVRKETDRIELQSITFVWMQGEKDARQGQGSVYAASLKGLIEQVRQDLHRPDMKVVIGRLSDFGLDKKAYPDWAMVREAQMAVAEADPHAAWVDTDAFNGPDNSLHLTQPEGYDALGKALAEKAIELLRKAAPDARAAEAASPGK